MRHFPARLWNPTPPPSPPSAPAQLSAARLPLRGVSVALTHRGDLSPNPSYSHGYGGKQLSIKGTQLSTPRLCVTATGMGSEPLRPGPRYKPRAPQELRHSGGACRDQPDADARARWACGLRRHGLCRARGGSLSLVPGWLARIVRACVGATCLVSLSALGLHTKLMRTSP